MFPWEHLVFGYVLYSLLDHLLWGRPISDAEGIAVALATQVPDLVDKPLSWTFGVVATGYGPAHSLFVGTPIVLLLTGLFWARDRHRVAAATLVGYGSHLVADALALRADGPLLGRVLWPLVTYESYDSHLSFGERFGAYVGRFLYQITHADVPGLLFGYVAVFVVVALLWVFDGTPGVRWVRRVTDA